MRGNEDDYKKRVKMTANKIRKYATDRARVSFSRMENDRDGQGDELIAREEKERLRGIIGYSCLESASRGCGLGKHGSLLPTGVVGVEEGHRRLTI